MESRKVLGGAVLVLLLSGGNEARAAVAGHDAGHAELVHFTTVLLFLGVMYLMARIGAVVERVGFPSVLGELSAGILLYNIASWSGIGIVEQLRSDTLIVFFAFLGVNLLLFKSGLEEQLGQMISVGPRAVIVAVVGMAMPFFGGFLLSRYIFFQDASMIVHVFVGATLVATSVGITAKIFQDLGYNGHTKSLVIGGAVMDDVMGLVLLSVVSSMAAGAAVTLWMIGNTTLTALGFMVGAILLGWLCAPWIGRLLSFIHPGVGMKCGMALAFCFTFAYAAVALGGLEPIIGAFAAGLILEHVHFKDFSESHQVTRLRRWIGQLSPEQVGLKKDMEAQLGKKQHGQVEHLIEGFARFFVPLFFVHTGMQVDLGVFANPALVGVALVITAVAVAGKLACGLVAGSQANRWIVGWSMVARGEVGLVFANIALAKGVFTAEHFAVMVMVVVLTTFIPPMVLPILIRRERARAYALLQKEEEQQCSSEEFSSRDTVIA